jgi:hypothetical protein
MAKFTIKLVSLINLLFFFRGTLLRSWLRHYPANRKVVGYCPSGIIAIFIEVILVAVLGPVVDLACNRNDYNRCLMVGKRDRCRGLTILLSSCADSLD